MLSTSSWLIYNPCMIQAVSVINIYVLVLNNVKINFACRALFIFSFRGFRFFLNTKQNKFKRGDGEQKMQERNSTYTVIACIIMHLYEHLLKIVLFMAKLSFGRGLEEIRKIWNILIGDVRF